MNGRLKRCLGIKLSSRLDESQMAAELTKLLSLILSYLEPLLYFIPQVPEQVDGAPVYSIETFPELLLSLRINLVATRAYNPDKAR